MAYLTRREHSRFELHQKLTRKGFPSVLVDSVIRDYSQRGYQSDTRFAEVYTRNRLDKGYGACRIRQELLQRGVDRDESGVFPEVDWDEQIEHVHHRKFGDRLPESAVERTIRERYLLRKGYSSDQIRSFFRRLKDGRDSNCKIE